jgi:hypothetical protein
MDRRSVFGAGGVAAAVGLVAVMAAPWFRGQAKFDGYPSEDLGTASAWELLEATDVALLVLALVVALALYAGRPAVALAAGALATALVVYRIFDRPLHGPYPGGGERVVEVEWGAYVALACAVAATLASLIAYLGQRD